MTLRRRTLLAHGAGAAAALSLLPAQVAAQNVLLSGTLGSNKALLVIDGQMHTVAVGSTVKGVTLRSLGADDAVVLIGGKPFSLRMGASPVSLGGGGGSGGGGSQIVLPVGPGGHFMARGSINGQSVNFMVDTGATNIAMDQSEAKRLNLQSTGRRGVANTAGGNVPIHEVNLRSVRIGDVEIYGLSAVVVPADMPYILLGNNYLSRFNMRREGDTMRLDKKP